MDRILQINGKQNLAATSLVFLHGDTFSPSENTVILSLLWSHRSTEADGDVVVEPGVKWEDLNAELKKRGIPLFFPVSHLRVGYVIWGERGIDVRSPF
jgi:hypothetical protein